MRTGVEHLSSRRVTETVLAVLLYGLGYWILHLLAPILAGPFSFYLWYPPAALRFCVLWQFGSRAIVPALLGECGVRLLLANPLIYPGVAITLTRTTVAVLSYVLVIAAIQRRARGNRQAGAAMPLPIGVAMIAAPAAAAAAGLPFEWLFPSTSVAVNTVSNAAMMLTIPTLGDILGVLLLGPLLLATFDWRNTRDRLRAGIAAAVVLRTAGALLVGCGVVLLFWQASHMLRLEPLLLAVAWIGLRHGRFAAWAAISLVMAGFLVGSAIWGAPAGDEIAMHMLIACIAIIGYLAGSYADAERQHRHEISRRDRMLYQAERLRTLRAMSLAVIHEISQPLSTLSIEARHMRILVDGLPAPSADLGKTAMLVERKTKGLVELVRRLRRFGGRSLDGRARISLAVLVEEVAALAAAEAAAADVTIEVSIGKQIEIEGQDIELQQAVLNLARNAIAATPGGCVRLSLDALAGDVARLRIEDDGDSPAVSARPGRGVGLLIARTIAEAHGGRIHRGDRAPKGTCFTIELPFARIAA